MKVPHRARQQLPCRKPVSRSVWLIVLLSTSTLRTEGIPVCPDDSQTAEDTLVGPRLAELSFSHSDEAAAAAVLRKLALVVFSPVRLCHECFAASIYTPDRLLAMMAGS